MRNRVGRFAVAAAAVVTIISVSITVISAQGGQTKTPAPTAAPAARGQATTPAAQGATAPARGQATPAPARGQASAAARGIPRMGDGKPNFSGLWQSLSGAKWDLQDHSSEPGPFYHLGAEFDIPAGQGVVDGNEIPYRSDALEQRKKNRLNRWTADPELKCYMPGIPRATYMPFPFQIVQGNTKIAFAYEFATSNRVVNMGAPTKAPVPSWMGWANGRWEGD